MREALVLTVVAVLPALAAVAWHPGLAERDRAGLEPGEVRLSEVEGWAVPVVWVDARDGSDFERGHVPGAMHFPAGEFEQRLGDLLGRWQPGERVVVYCSSTSCGSSRELAERLRAAGMSDVFYLRGGWEAWQAAATR